jgi:hypothetical protein
MEWKKTQVREKPRTGALGGLFRSAQGFRKEPDNQFAHASGLLSASGQGVNKASDISEILNQACFLGLQNKDEFIRFWQIDAFFITNLFTMAKESESDALMRVFSNLYTIFKFEVRLTGNKDGLERKLQHSFGGAGMNAAQIGRLMEQYQQMQGENYGPPQEKKGLFG